MYNFRLTGNTKLGVIPVTRSPQVNCPDTCSLKNNGCYAENFRLGAAWKKDLAKGFMFEDLVSKIRKLPKGSLWRHNEAGELSQDGNGNINANELELLINANKGKRGFTYTHHVPNEHNSKLIKDANDRGFTINLSAESLTQADTYFLMNVAPVVTLLPIESEKVTLTPNGVRIVKCPASYNTNITCEKCVICQKSTRNYIIGFPAHGVRKKSVEKILLQNI